MPNSTQRTLAGRATPPAVVEQGIDRLRHDEARAALASGDFARAKQLYLIITRINPTDALAWREAGRAMHALGELGFAVGALRRAERLRPIAPDPELHYLLGEALYSQGEVAAARSEHVIAEREIGPEPSDRMETLWLARIFARRGETARADALYRRLLDPKRPDVEVTINRIEAYVLAKRWRRAEALLRAFLDAVPDHPRGRAMLAWVLEAQRKLGEETSIRRDLATRAAPVDFTATMAYGRALERSRDYRGALARYREAAQIDPDGDPALSASIQRLAHRLSFEAFAAGVLRRDPSGANQELRVGAALPIGSEHLVSFIASYQAAESSVMSHEARIAAFSGSAVLGMGRDLTSAFTLSLHNHDMTAGAPEESGNELNLAAAVAMRTAANKRVQLHLRADFGMPWNEAASTVREGGTVTGLTTHLYALPIRDRLVLDAGMRARRMELRPVMDETPLAEQTMVFGGADVVAWVDPTQTARGQILDEELLFPTYHADAWVLSYRHYESFGNNDFGTRLVLADRASIDELSTTARKNLGAGEITGEARAGIGYDWARDLRMWRAGGSLLFSPTSATRITLTYDVATESSTGLVGRRHDGWVSFHADL